MADIVVQAVIQKAVDIASNLVFQQVSRSSKVKGDIDWIETEMRYIQSYLEDADSRQGEDSLVAALVRDIRTLGSDVEDILDTYFPKLVQSTRKKGYFRSAFGFFSYKLTANSFSAQIDAIRTRANEINRRRVTYHIKEKITSGHEEGAPYERRTFPHVDEPNVVGFEEHITKLEARMLDSQNGTVISITGMPGLGKTTLARKVYNSVRPRFECSAWICVSQQPNVVELLREIARQVGLEEIGGCVSSEIGYLSHLTYIGLRLKHSFIELPSSISNLRCLLTLDAGQCYEIIIPCSIWKMKQLRHILLPKNTGIKYNKRRYVWMGKFEPTAAAAVNLQTLYRLNIENLPAKYWFPKFTSLRKLGVIFHSESGLSKVKVLLDAVTESTKLETLRLETSFGFPYNLVDLNLCRYENLSTLRVQGALLELPQHDKLPQNLTKLTLRLIALKEDPMETLKKLPKLKILKFHEHSYIGEKMLVRSGGGEGGPNDNFPQLQVLELDRLYDLEKFIAEEEEVMPRLKTLSITNCDKLQNGGEIRLSDRIRDVMITTKSLYKMQTSYWK